MLFILRLGTRNATKHQIGEALGWSSIDDEKLHASYKDIHSAITDTGDAYALHSASRLFADKSYSFLKAFIDDSLEHYGAAHDGVDFQSDHEGARALINSWVAEKTKDKIKELF